MITAENITCANNALFVMQFTIQWLTSGGEWETSQWSSPKYVKGVVVTSPPLLSQEVGVPADALAVRPHVQAVLGLSHYGTPVVRAALNNRGAAYEITGTTLDFEVRLRGVLETPEPQPEWSNWSGNLVHRPPQGADPYYHNPTNLSELKAVVASIAELRKTQSVTLRVSGQRHSQPPLVTGDNRSTVTGTTKAYLVDLSCYADLGPDGDRTMVLDRSDPDNPRVTVNTGVLEGELDAFLTGNDLMLKTVTAGGFFSVGGITAVDVHGATVDAPIFAETVSAFTILRGDGSVVTISNDTPVDGWSPLQFARVSMGALGIVTSVTIDVAPRPYATTLKPTREAFQLAGEQDFVAKYKTLLQHERMESFLNPYSLDFLALCWDRDPDPAQKTPNRQPAAGTACALAALHDFGAPDEGIFIEPVAQGVAQSAQLAEGWDQPLIGADALIGTAFGQIDEMYDAAKDAHSDLWLTQAARVIFMSYFIELPDLDDTGLSTVWKGLSAVIDRVKQVGSFHVAGPLEFRFVRGGNTALSGTYTDKPEAHFVNLDLIGFVKPTVADQYPPKLLQFFAEVEADWVALGGFPHNGKMYGFYDPAAPKVAGTAPFNPAFLAELRRRRGERLAAFNAYRTTQDPQGLFYSDFMRALLEGRAQSPE